VSDKPVLAKTAHLGDGYITIDGKPIPWHVAEEIRYVQVRPAQDTRPPLYELHLRVLVNSEPTVDEGLLATATTQTVDINYRRRRRTYKDE
jgi:hypothetical protein